NNAAHVRPEITVVLRAEAPSREGVRLTGETAGEEIDASSGKSGSCPGSGPEPRLDMGCLQGSDVAVGRHTREVLGWDPLAGGADRAEPERLVPGPGSGEGEPADAAEEIEVGGHTRLAAERYWGSG